MPAGVPGFFFYFVKELSSRFVLRTGTKDPRARASLDGHVDALYSRFVNERGLKALAFSPESVVPNGEPGLKGAYGQMG